MKVYTDELYESMQSTLAKIEGDAGNTLQKAEQSYCAIKDILLKISSYMATYTFSDESEEILFLKTVKPKFLAELIYFAELYYVEAGKPAAGQKAASSYFKKTMDTIRMYFERNHDFYNYWLLGRTDLDHVYFLRGAQAFHLPPEYASDPDPSGLTTFYCFKLSRLLALEKLKAYIELLLSPAEEISTYTSSKNQFDGLNWTDNKSGLVELLYAVQSKGAINNGNIDLKQMVAAFENFLHISLGNYYGVFQQNIRIRKKNRTQYLDQLKQRLEMRMNEEDEHPRF